MSNSTPTYARNLGVNPCLLCHGVVVPHVVLAYVAARPKSVFVRCGLFLLQGSARVTHTHTCLDDSLSTRCFALDMIRQCYGLC